jgi:hypothetical protein
MRDCILGVIVAVLILVQSVFATGQPVSYTPHETSSSSTHKTEVKLEMAAKASFAVVDVRITLTTFLYFWLVRDFILDVPLIAYHNCKAFFINPHFFHVFYICLSALAP